MKGFSILMVVAFLFSAGCRYHSPLSKDHNISIDSSILGLWGEKEKAKANLVILKYSDTEYLIHFFTNRDGVYWRGYPIKITGVTCIQLQAIGTDDGPHPEENDPFAVVSYLLINDKLEIKLLNTDLVSNDLKSKDALNKAFSKHKDNKDLFVEPKMYHRVKD